MERMIVSSGNVKIKIEGISKVELGCFFSPFFQIESVITGTEKIVCTISIIKLDTREWLEIKSEFENMTAMPIILYNSKRISHHVEGKKINILYGTNNIILLQNGYIEIDKINKKIIIRVIDLVNNQQIFRVVIRNVIQKEWERLGGLLIHASAAVYQNKTYLFVGKKGSGKTNFLLHFLKKNAQILSFDKVILNYEKNTIKCYGWPTYFNIDIPTVLRFADLLELNKIENERPHIDGKISLIAEQVRHMGLINEGILSEIIFPKFNEFQNSIKIEKLSTIKVLDILQNECLTYTHSEDWHNMVNFNWKINRIKKNKIFTYLLNDHISCKKISFGLNQLQFHQILL